MSTRQIKDAVNHSTKELVYFKGHAKATFMSDGKTVEDAINSIEIPSLDEYVTETELNDKGYLTEHQDISHLASKTWVESQEYAHQEDLLNISFNDIQGSPITIDESGELNFVDESGNVGFKVNEEGLYVKDVVAGDHKLSEKANSIDIPTHTSQLINNSGYITRTVVDQAITELVDGAPETLNTLNELASALKDNSDVVDVLNQSISSKQDTIADLESIREGAELGKTALQEVPEGYAKTEDIPSVEGLASEQWVNNKNFVQRTDLLNLSFNDIQGSPITEDESGELNFVDESSNVGLKVNNEGIYVKDVIAGEHVLSQKQNALVDGETIKTINGQSILGEGNIEIGIGGSGKIYEGSISNNITLVPNHMYVRNYSFGRLIINGFESTKNENGRDTLSDEYWIMLRCGFEEIDPGITWPDEYYDIQWMDGVEPEIEIDKSYIFHITRYRHPVNGDQNIYLVDYKVFKKKTNINESDSEISNEVTFPIYIDLNESPTTNDLNDRMALYNYLMEKYDLKNARINGPTDLDPSDDININGVLGPEYSKIKEVLHDGYDLIALRGKVNEFDYYQLSSTGDISVYID